jgi:hypothetical protein
MSEPVICPEHPGLTNDPSHWLNLIDRHCVPYTYAELILFGGGCLMWVVAYGILIRDSFRFKYMEMAAVAGCSNIAWEFIWSWAFQTDMGRFLVWTYRAWFFLDVFIFWQLLRLGDQQVTQPAFKKHFKPAAILITLAFASLYYFYAKQGMDTLIGANSAYLCQLVISSTCLLLLLGSPTLRGFSMPIAWLRSVGTGLNTVMMILHYPDNHFLHLMGILSAIMDAVYIYSFYGRRRAERAEKKGPALQPA